MKVIEQAKVLKILSKFRIPTSNSMIVKTKKEALKAAKKIKYPLTMKIMAPEIVHKTEFNAIRLGINNDEKLEKAYGELEKVVKKKKIKGANFLIQSMEYGQEVIIGVKKDTTFNHVLMFGMGGIFVEILKDVSFRIAPINKKQAMQMISEIKGFHILEGARGKAGVNLDAIANMIVNLSKLVEKNKSITQIDLNPVIVNEKNAKVVDARMMSDEKK